MRGNPRSEGSRFSATLLGSSIGVMLMVLLGKLFGFGEKLFLAHVGGTAPAIDAYFAASGFAFLFFVLADDIVAPVFLARYLWIRLHRGTRAATTYFRKSLWLTMAAFGVPLFVITIRPDLVVSLIAPGFDPSRAALTAQLLRFTVAGGFLLSLSAVAAAFLNAHRSFIWPAFAGAVHKGIIVVAVVVLVPWLGIVGAAAGAVVAAVTQVVMNWIRIAGHHSLPSDDRDGEITERAAGTVGLIVPLAIGTLAAQLGGLVDTAYGSKLASGSLAALGYARKLVDLPLLLVPSVLALVSYPRFAELASRRRHEELISTASRLAEFCLAVFAPLATVLFLDARPVTQLALARGAFGPEAVEITAIALRAFALGVVAFSLEIILLRVFYAGQDTLTPMWIGLSCLAVHLVLTISLTPRIGLTAIPLAISAQKILKVACLIVVLYRRHVGPWARETAWRLLRIAGCWAVFTAVFAVFDAFSPEIVGGSASRTLVGIGSRLLPAGAVYMIAMRSFGVVDRDQVTRAVFRLRRLLRVR